MRSAPSSSPSRLLGEDAGSRHGETRRRWARFAVARARLMAKPHLSGRAPKLGLTSGSRPLPLGGLLSIKRIFRGPGTVAEIGATRYLFGPSNRLPRMMRRDDEPSKEESGEREPWSSLMGRAQTGDRDAYRRLLIEITPYVRALAGRHHRDHADVEDTTQDVLLTVHVIRHTYDPARPFAPWLAAITQRRIVDRLRKQGRTRSRET